LRTLSDGMQIAAPESLTDGETTFDVVTIPDFSGPAALRFEAQVLFLLASWMERREAGMREIPFRLACIGEPPASVRWLADRAEASVAVMEPVGIIGSNYLNKLRGLEIGGEHPARLLIDADTLVLGDLRPLRGLGRCLAAAPTGRPRIVAEEWMAIYAELGMPAPKERMESLAGMLGQEVPNLSAREVEEAAAMFPYYNAGVVFVGREVPLRELWQEHALAIAEGARRTGNTNKAICNCDQVSLATTIQALRARGIPFRDLPLAYNVRPRQIQCRQVPLGEVRIFHARKFMHGIRPGPGGVERALEGYAWHKVGVAWSEVRAWRDPFPRKVARALREALPARRDARRLRAIGRRLHERFVRPALVAGRSLMAPD